MQKISCSLSANVCKLHLKEQYPAIPLNLNTNDIHSRMNLNTNNKLKTDLNNQIFQLSYFATFFLWEN